VNAEMIAHTIMFILAPAVMLNATAVFFNGLLGDYATLNDRMRKLAFEKLELLRAVQDALSLERLQEIDTELPAMLHRHKILRNAILLISIAIALYVLTMLLIALAAFGVSWIETAALILFLFSTALMLVGILYKVLEVHNSHFTVAFEVERIHNLPRVQTNQVEGAL
jgi:ABC-type glycerol-3-phosphate transport system permease component